MNIKPVYITAANSLGTQFVHATLDDVIRALKNDHKSNEILIYLLERDGFYALDFDNNFYGGYADDDNIYICITDGEDIEVEGELVYPEDAIDKFGVDAVADYTREATEHDITFRITGYELKPFSMEDVAIDMLNDGYSFNAICDAADDIGIL